MIFWILKKQKIFTINTPAEQNVELMAKQGVKWVGDPKNFLFNFTIECS